MGFLIQIGLAAIGLWAGLVIAIFVITGAFYLLRFLLLVIIRAFYLLRFLLLPVPNKVANVAAAILIAMALVVPLVGAVVEYAQ